MCTAYKRTRVLLYYIQMACTHTHVQILLYFRLYSHIGGKVYPPWVETIAPVKAFEYHTVRNHVDVRIQRTYKNRWSRWNMPFRRPWFDDRVSVNNPTTYIISVLLYNARKPATVKHGNTLWVRGEEWTAILPPHTRFRLINYSFACPILVPLGSRTIQHKPVDEIIWNKMEIVRQKKKKNDKQTDNFWKNIISFLNNSLAWKHISLNNTCVYWHY